MMFDPFENRISRDIRNELSGHFLDDLLAKNNPGRVDENTAALKRKAPDADHLRYIDARVENYRKVYRESEGAGPFEIARRLWNYRLFFECHEWLEPLWMNADGSEKKAIQGIIRAAGAHVLDEAGRKSPARTSAQKALVLIRDHSAQIPLPFNTDHLIRALNRLLGS